MRVSLGLVVALCCWSQERSHLSGTQVSAFLAPNNSNSCLKYRYLSKFRVSSAAADDAPDNAGTRLERRLLDDFRIAGGEVINPYNVLSVSRSADRSEIKSAYRKLSRRYHPDGILQRDDGILPGRCNNMDDVREEWERIKLSYEILTDRKMRVRYDRNSALADPAAAMGRAALGTIGWGLSGVGKGIVSFGKMTLNQGKNK
mmetsp:Transcript_11891/g.25744  ORF Transcript_11891/g.25744 Transcript_11891/m.25744 type:complete len:202 (+) Transcript_11891:95-700(+)